MVSEFVCVCIINVASQVNVPISKNDTIYHIKLYFFNNVRNQTIYIRNTNSHSNSTFTGWIFRRPILCVHVRVFM